LHNSAKGYLFLFAPQLEAKLDKGRQFLNWFKNCSLLLNSEKVFHKRIIRLGVGFVTSGIKVNGKIHGHKDIKVR
jgi:hypothetical protein